MRMILPNEKESAKKIGKKVWPPEGADINSLGMFSVDDGIIQESIGNLLMLVENAYKSEKLARQQLEKRDEEVLGEYKEQQRRDFAGSIHTCNDVEWKRYRAFWSKHYKTCVNGKNEVSCKKIIHLLTDGLGECITCECPVCHEQEDITDFSNW